MNDKMKYEEWKMDKIAVLIPCYNEEKTIAKVVSDVKKFLPEAVTYVYDNNSTDRTVELATEAFSRLGYTPQFRTISWPDKDNLLSDGTIDCIWSCFSMSGRETKYQWAGPYMYSRQVVAVRADSDIQSLSDLAGKRIGVQATTKAESLFLGEISSLLPEVKQVNSFETTEDMFAALRKGYVDAVAGHEALVAKLTNLDESSYRVLAESPYSSELGVAFAKDTHEDLAVQLTQTLEDMKQDGTIGRVAEKFGLDAEKTVWGEQGK